MHSAAGTFDLALDRAAGITCAITVELRIIGVGHRIVFQFDAPKTSSGLASLIDVANAPIGSVKTQVIGNDVVLTLTNVADNRRVKVGLTGVNGSLNASVSIGFLAGDVNNSFSVNASDITAIKARSGQTVGVSANNFRYDINVSGSINASDIITVKERSGVALGTSPSPAVQLANVAAPQVSMPSALNANATIGSGGAIARVEFFDGAAKIGEVATPPYTLNWTTGVEGQATLIAKAVDANGAFNFSAPITIAVGPHPQADAARLLTQATFGSPVAEISRVALLTPSVYLDEQFNIAQTLHMTTVRNDLFYPTTPYSVIMPSIWNQYFEAPDQLRQRVAFALSQIMVISMNNNTNGD